jgi:hypothetical protein
MGRLATHHAAAAAHFKLFALHSARAEEPGATGIAMVSKPRKSDRTAAESART